MDFNFQGEMSSSKSLYNRGLVAQSFAETLQLQGFSEAEDVRVMKSALAQFRRGEAIDCGQAGTVIRFMAFRASREKGSFLLRGSPRLLSRPMTELIDLLAVLGVQADLSREGLKIRSEGWRNPGQSVFISGRQSSQFASGLLLSCWNLDFDLTFQGSKEMVSQSYFRMTLEMMRRLGFRFEELRDGTRVPAGQSLRTTSFQLEPDYSSMFPIAVAGALFGRSRFQNVPESSLQPDFQFIEILRQFRIPIRREVSSIQFDRALDLQGTRVNLREQPDLFPVLAVLCAFARGESSLEGAPHLVHKESNRLIKTKELLEAAGVPCELQEGGLRIQGQGLDFRPRAFVYDPDQDHRMAMAAALFQWRQPELQILSPEVVVKSFPEFWRIFRRSQEQETP